MLKIFDKNPFWRNIGQETEKGSKKERMKSACIMKWVHLQMPEQTKREGSKDI